MIIKIIIFSFFTFFMPNLLSCPTCVGLPRPGERPFFERQALLSLIDMNPPKKQHTSSSRINNQPDKSSDKQ
jgi:hypothetical protein